MKTFRKTRWHGFKNNRNGSHAHYIAESMCENSRWWRPFQDWKCSLSNVKFFHQDAKQVDRVRLRVHLIPGIICEKFWWWRPVEVRSRLEHVISKKWWCLKSHGPCSQFFWQKRESARWRWKFRAKPEQKNHTKSMIFAFFAQIDTVWI